MGDALRPRGCREGALRSLSMASRYGASLWWRVLVGCALLFENANAGKAAVGGCKDPQPQVEGGSANETIFENWHDQFVIDPLAAIATRVDSVGWLGGHVGNRPNKRQNCQGSGSTARNYCFAGNTAANAWCACINKCCTNAARSTGWCCNATVDCDVSNLSCRWITSTTSIVRTITNYVTSSYTVSITLPGGTSTSLVTITSVSTLTISSADTATIIATTTVSELRAGKRDVLPSIAAAAISTQAARTTASIISSTTPLDTYRQDAVTPQITRAPSLDGEEEDEEEQHDNPELRKRQAPTSTVVIGTATIYVTTVLSITSTARPSATTTSTTTSWSTSTVYLNAKATRTVMTTLNLATLSGSAPPVRSGDPVVPVEPGNKGLSTGAKAGIGAGTAGGSLLICLILGFIWRRRKKSRDEKNQVMINDAVTAAMAAQQKNHPGQDSHPTSYIANDKARYSNTYPCSTNTYGTPTGSPPPHSPQPMYPAPMHPMPYNSANVPTPPQQYHRLSELPENHMAAYPPPGGERPQSYGIPHPGHHQSPEMPATPVMPRYEMYPGSPPASVPAPYGGPPQQYHGGGPGYRQ